MHGLDCKAAVDISQDKAAMTEDTFNIDSSGYGTKVSSVRHLALTQQISPVTPGLAPI
jgi:hypothetical protein